MRLIARHPRDIAKDEKAQLARPFAQSVCVLQLDLVAIVLEDLRVECKLVRSFGWTKRPARNAQSS